MNKIAFFISSLHNPAGMERVLSVRVNELCNYYDVTIITHNQGNKPDYFPLDTRINRIDIMCDDSLFKQKVIELLMTKHVDLSVSTGGAEFFFLHSIKDGSKKIFEFHFSFDIAKVWVGNKVKGFRRWRYIQQQTFHRIYHARKYDRVVVLCKADYRKWRRYCRKVTYIYNPLTIDNPKISDCSTKKAIAVGRLHSQKGFDYLIDSWKAVYDKYPDWQLNIYGEGEERENLQAAIDKNGLTNNMFLRGRTDNVVDKYAESSIFILSSRDEAFGLVITEAEACGLPIVAFDCPSAPKELVDDEKNGFVVLLGDTKAMADKIITLIEDAQLRKCMGKASLDVSQRFSVKTITQQWNTLYRGLLV